MKGLDASKIRIAAIFGCLTIGCLAATHGRSRRTETNPGRIYRSVERLDTVSGEWERLNASARLTQRENETVIVIWNNWSDEKINPLIRIVIGREAECTEEGDGRRRYAGVVSRGLGSTQRGCTVESCTIIAETASVVEWTILTSDYSTRYRISREIPRKS